MDDKGILEAISEVDRRFRCKDSDEQWDRDALALRLLEIVPEFRKMHPIYDAKSPDYMQAQFMYKALHEECSWLCDIQDLSIL